MFKNRFETFFKILSYVALTLSTLSALLFAILQTSYAKKSITEKLITLAKSHQIELSIDNLHGHLPFTWNIDSLSLTSPEYGHIALKQITFKLALLPLFKGKIVTSLLDIEKVHLPDLYPILYTDSPSMLNAEDALFFANHFKKIRLQKVYCYSESVTTPYYLLIENKNRHTHLKILQEEMRFYLEARLHFSLKTKMLNGHLTLDLQDTTVLNPFVNIPFNFSTRLELEAKKGPLSPLNTKLKGTFTPVLPNLQKTWEIEAHSAITPQKVTVDALTVTSELGSLSGNFSYNFEDHQYDYLLKALCPNIEKLLSHNMLEGSFETLLTGKNQTFSINLSSSELTLSDQELSPLELKLDLQKNKDWVGILQGNFSESLPFKILSHVTLGDFYTLRDFQLKCQDDILKLDLAFDPQKRSLEANTTLSVQNLTSYNALLGSIPIEGSLQANLSLDEKTLNFHLDTQKLRYQDVYTASMMLDGNLINFMAPTGAVMLEIKQLSSSQYSLENLAIKSSSIRPSIWPFSINSTGNYKTPFTVEALGEFSLLKGNKKELTLEKLEGVLLSRDFNLKSKASCSWGMDEFLIEPMKITTTGGNFQLSAFYTPQRGSLKFEAAHLPLELFNFVSKEVGLAGCASLYLDLHSCHNKPLEGSLRLILEEADVHQNKLQSIPFTNAVIQAHFAKDHMQLFSEINAADKQSLSLQSSLPLQYSHYPLSLKLDASKNASANLFISGKIEEIFDFIDLGSNRLTGNLNTQLFFSGTLESPKLSGKIELENGTYESYTLGTYLQAISLTLQAENDTLTLKNLSAQDTQKGSLSAEGSLKLSLKEHFPYKSVLEVSHLEYLDLDQITASFSGPLYVEGTTQELSIRGNLLIDDATCQLMDDSTSALPDISVEYIHFPKKARRISAPYKAIPFKVALEAELSANSRVFINGKGLKSEWKGHVILKTHNNNIELQGHLDILKGEYLFAGKRFILEQEGEIHFSENAEPFINLKALSTIGAYTVTIHLQGLLSEPRILFSSMPSLPTSSILSYILFNKDVSEISPFQAIQLAHTLVSLSSSSSTALLSKIQSKLGIDRFDIVSDPRGGDQVSLQIGKYLTRGVLVTLSQSQNTSDVIIEVDLKHGFVFQAESQDQQEGKFSLKWHHNY